MILMGTSPIALIYCKLSITGSTLIDDHHIVYTDIENIKQNTQNLEKQIK